MHKHLRLCEHRLGITRLAGTNANAFLHTLLAALQEAQPAPIVTTRSVCCDARQLAGRRSRHRARPSLARVRSEMCNRHRYWNLNWSRYFNWNRNLNLYRNLNRYRNLNWYRNFNR